MWMVISMNSAKNEYTCVDIVICDIDKFKNKVLEIGEKLF